ncbi:hypothetical protein KUF71_010707 [Frankliniella fusca]|uniref:Uncharacterized protein n=1 Tax=Frankliniella fusca TaxID=407009 RepID=A0AAE1HHM6_9NEOP|nr:hypothetical protein KUF71_010707 [Frankliniella fusca]
MALSGPALNNPALVPTQTNPKYILLFTKGEDVYEFDEVDAELASPPTKPGGRPRKEEKLGMRLPRSHGAKGLSPLDPRMVDEAERKASPEDEPTENEDQETFQKPENQSTKAKLQNLGYPDLEDSNCIIKSLKHLASSNINLEKRIAQMLTPIKRILGYVKYVTDENEWKLLTKADKIREFMQIMMTTGGVEPSTAKNYIEHILKLMEYAQDRFFQDEGMPANPAESSEHCAPCTLRRYNGQLLLGYYAWVSCQLFLYRSDSRMMMSLCTSLMGDGTFGRALQPSYELYTIHGYKDGYHIPLTFFPLNGKSEELYPPSVWASVPTMEPATTNGAEAFHADFNAQFNSSHPNIFASISILQQVQAQTYLKINSVKNMESNYIRPKGIELKERRMTAWQEVLNGERTVYSYLLYMGSLNASMNKKK